MYKMKYIALIAQLNFIMQLNRQFVIVVKIKNWIIGLTIPQEILDLYDKKENINEI